MPPQKDIIPLQQAKIKRIQETVTPYPVHILGKEILVYPHVFYPATDTELIIKTIHITSQETVLDVCAGTGVIGLFAAAYAKKVIATDINPDAIKNIQANIIQWDITQKMQAAQTDIFPLTQERFDVIIANPPYTNHPATNIIEQAFWDQDHQMVRRFLRDAYKHLTTNGRIYLSWANFADFTFIEELIHTHHYTIINCAEQKKEEKIYRVYELRAAHDVSQ